MKVLAFSDEEQMQLFRTVAAVCHLGNIEVKQRAREEQAEMHNTGGRVTHGTRGRVTHGTRGRVTHGTSLHTMMALLLV